MRVIKTSNKEYLVAPVPVTALKSMLETAIIIKQTPTILTGLVASWIIVSSFVNI